MRILFLHTHYQQHGGEDFVVDQEVALLSSNNEVKLITFSNRRGLVGAIQFFTSIFNIYTFLKIRREVLQFKPDVIHIHNWHFALGPLTFLLLSYFNIPIIHTVHNFRLLCPSAILLAGNEIFTKSLEERFPWTAIKRKLYRGSYLQTFWLAFIIYAHKLLGSWSKIDAYIFLTAFSSTLFQKSKFSIPSEKCYLKPNFVDSSFCNTVKTHSGAYLFVGRLSYEKGIKVLLEVFIENGQPLEIIGDGDLRESVIKTCEKYPNITYLGFQKKEYIQDRMTKAKALIFPSIWFEGMPMTIIEAFSNSLPIIASNVGAMSTMIIEKFNGMLFEVNNASSLSDVVNMFDAFSHAEKSTMAANAYQDYIGKYTPDVNYHLLIDIYKDVIDKKLRS